MSDMMDEEILFLGEEIVEMADRLAVVTKACPGAQASYEFELGGQIFHIVMTIDEN